MYMTGRSVNYDAVALAAEITERVGETLCGLPYLMFSLTKTIDELRRSDKKASIKLQLY